MNCNTCVDAASALSDIGDSYCHFLDPMASERWNKDIAYAVTPLKLIMWPLGVWPLQVYNEYSLIRCVVTTCCMVRFLLARPRFSMRSLLVVRSVFVTTKLRKNRVL